MLFPSATSIYSNLTILLRGALYSTGRRCEVGRCVHKLLKLRHGQGTDIGCSDCDCCFTADVVVDANSIHSRYIAPEKYSGAKLLAGGRARCSAIHLADGRTDLNHTSLRWPYRHPAPHLEAPLPACIAPRVMRFSPVLQRRPVYVASRFECTWQVQVTVV